MAGSSSPHLLLCEWGSHTIALQCVNLLASHWSKVSHFHNFRTISKSPPLLYGTQSDLPPAISLFSAISQSKPMLLYEPRTTSQEAIVYHWLPFLSGQSCFFQLRRLSKKFLAPFD